MDGQDGQEKARKPTLENSSASRWMEVNAGACLAVQSLPPLRGSRRSRPDPWDLPCMCCLRCLRWACRRGLLKCRRVGGAALSLSKGPAKADAVGGSQRLSQADSLKKYERTRFWSLTV